MQAIWGQAELGRKTQQHASELHAGLQVTEATRLAKEQRPDLAIDGPLQYDAAVDPVIARQKVRMLLTCQPCSPCERCHPHTLYLMPMLSAQWPLPSIEERAGEGGFAGGGACHGLHLPHPDSRYRGASAVLCTCLCSVRPYSGFLPWVSAIGSVRGTLLCLCIRCHACTAADMHLMPQATARTRQCSRALGQWPSAPSCRV